MHRFPEEEEGGSKGRGREGPDCLAKAIGRAKSGTGLANHS